MIIPLFGDKVIRLMISRQLEDLRHKKVMRAHKRQREAQERALAIASKLGGKWLQRTIDSVNAQRGI